MQCSGTVFFGALILYAEVFFQSFKKLFWVKPIEVADYAVVADNVEM